MHIRTLPVASKNMEGTNILKLCLHYVIYLFQWSLKFFAIFNIYFAFRIYLKLNFEDGFRIFALCANSFNLMVTLKCIAALGEIIWMSGEKTKKKEVVNKWSSFL